MMWATDLHTYDQTIQLSVQMGICVSMSDPSPALIQLSAHTNSFCILYRPNNI